MTAGMFYYNELRVLQELNSTAVSLSIETCPATVWKVSDHVKLSN